MLNEFLDYELPPHAEVTLTCKGCGVTLLMLEDEIQQRCPNWLCPICKGELVKAETA